MSEPKITGWSDYDQIKKERDEAQDHTDEEWLGEIGRQWLNRTGQPWETRDGETREEGLQANITALFQVIENLTKEREEAQKACAEMREVLQSIWDVDGMGYIVDVTGYKECGVCGYKDGKHETECLEGVIEHALSTDCGKGWASPNEIQIIKSELAAKVAELTIAKAKVAEMQEAQIKFPDNLSALTVGLVLRFAQAMADKLSAAQIKHGYCDGWAQTTHAWPVPECHEALVSHLKKGDPVDVANFCAFLWYHKIGTADCGRGYVPVSELEQIIGHLAYLCSFDYNHGITEALKRELAHLQALKEGK